MKKIYFTLILIVASLATSYATNYFVDPVGGSDNAPNDGLSWATAYKTLTKVDGVITAHTANADNVFIKGGTITLSTGTKWNPTSQNYYFSCAGTETTPAERPLQDNDGNGIVEPWEFANPTSVNLKVLLTSDQIVGLNVSTLLDGVRISCEGSTSTGNVGLAVIRWNETSSSIFQNSIVKNCNVAYTYTNSKSASGCLFLVRGNGLVKNCLVEKNSINIKETGANVSPEIAPIASLNLRTASLSNPQMINVVIRNNKAVFDFTDAVNTSSTNLKALVLSVSAGNASYSNSEAVYSNCLVYNNEFIFNGNATVNQAAKASLVGPCGLTAGKLVYKNCLFANNKLTNMAYAGYLELKAKCTYKLYNNVFWNNQNTITATSTTSGVGLYSSGAQPDTAIVTNNVLDIASSGTWGTAMTYANNLEDLAVTNIGTNAPIFTNATIFNGANRVAGSADSIAIAQAKWTLGAGSYLIGKGTAYSGIDKDLAGVSFASSPAVGVYEYVPNLPTQIGQTLDKNVLVKISNNRVVALVDQELKVYSIAGVLVKQVILKANEGFILPAGLYLLNSLSATQNLVYKVRI